LNPRVVVIISSDGEWATVPRLFPEVEFSQSPHGEWFTHIINDESIIFYHGNWGKVPSAASTQYIIDRWKPELLVNIGTCGGFKGEVEKFDVVLVEKAVIYDIFSLMSDPETTVGRTTTTIDLDWLGDSLPMDVSRATIVSGDRDIHPEDIESLKQKYSAKAGDWESGSIAYVCNKNGVKLLILRGVSDIVSTQGGEAYEGKKALWYESAERIIRELVESLPDWLRLL